MSDGNEKGLDGLKLLDTTANPAPLGLLGFGMTTGTPEHAQCRVLCARFDDPCDGYLLWRTRPNRRGDHGVEEKQHVRRNCILLYGCFWLSLVALIILPALGIAQPVDLASMAAYLLMWGFFTAVMFAGTLKLSRALQFVFGSLTILFFLLALGEMTGIGLITTVAGIEGIICGLSAMYAGLGQVLNELYKEPVVRLG